MLTHEQHVLFLVAGIGSVLIVASLVGALLKLRVAKGEPHAVIDNLNVRVNAWWAIAAVIGLALMAGYSGAVLLFAFASFVALCEFVTATSAGRVGRVMAVTAAVVVALQYFLVWRGWHAAFSTFIPLYAFLIVPLLAAVLKDRHPFLHVASGQWGLVICVYCISYVPALFTLHIAGYEGRNVFLVLFLIVVVQASDVLQYIWGKLAGRHRIAPALSPSKTVEGTAGGVLSAAALGASLSWMTPFSISEAALVSFAITVLGFIGGLVMSGIKRRRGIKDWGTVIRGHGGMLDRLDSVWLSAPAFYYMVSYGYAR